MISAVCRAAPEPTERVLAIGFRGRRVVVHAGAPEVLPALARHFRHFGEAGRGRVVGRVRIIARAGVYDLPTDDPAQCISGSSLEYVILAARGLVIQYLVEASPELLWLHAGAAAFGGHAALVVGAAGAGKSSIVTALAARGWGYLSDDTVGVDPARRAAVPFPILPSYRVGPMTRMADERIDGLPKVVADLGATGVCREPAPIGAIILPAFDPGGSPNLAACRPAEAVVELLLACHGTREDRVRLLTALCDLVGDVPVYRLAYRTRDEAADLIERAHSISWPAGSLP